MPTVPTLSGITSQMIQTDRINTHVLSSGPEDGQPVVFVHGNLSAATYWEEIMLDVPGDYRCLAPDLRGFGDTEDLRVDATRGARDWSDDLKSLSDTLGDKPAHLVGWSLGGGVVMQFALDYPELTTSLTLISPVSPFGFGGTKGAAGTPCYDDFAGSGGGAVNPAFMQSLRDGDRGRENPASLANTIDAFYFKPPFHAAREAAFISASLLEKLGDDRYPGDMTPSENWPNVAPGKWGPINALTPKYFNTSGITEMANRPPILWVRGDSDQITSDNSMFDLGALGKLGAVPGWPGDDVFPPQPMVAQTRYVLDQYQANGGVYEEAVISDAAHGPQIEKQDEFMGIFTAFLAG